MFGTDFGKKKKKAEKEMIGKLLFNS